MSKIHIGISGWTFDGWRGNFYPEGLRSKDELAFASRMVGAIEINGTFHSLFRPANFQSWYDQAPSGFHFAVKAPKYITHERRLKNFETPLSNFLASGLLLLGEKLGPILWQFPPTLPFTAERFEPFMRALPRDMKTAAALGTGYSTWMEGRTFLEPAANLPMRHAIEGRHASFKSVEFVEMARKYGIAVVVGDTAGRWPYMEDVTSDFIYIRLHGDETKYPDGYTKAAMERWAERFQTWARGVQPADAQIVLAHTPKPDPRPVFAFFDNDVKELAALNALSMISHLTQIGVLGARIVVGMPEIAAKRGKGAKAGKTAGSEEAPIAERSAKVARAPRIEKAPKAAKTPKAAEAAEASKAAKAPAAAKTPKAAKAPAAAKTSKAAKAPAAAKTSKAAKAPAAAKTPKAAPVRKRPAAAAAEPTPATAARRV